MPAKRETRPGAPFLLNDVDRSGRPIAPEVLSVARDIGPRLTAYAENLIGDPAIAITYLEEAAASVSDAIKEKTKSGAPGIRNLDAYLFRTFIHLVDNAKRREANIEQSLQQYGETQFSFTEEGRTETMVLINEVMATCDQVSGEIVMLRLEDWSWAEIGTHLGISPHAAETRFRKALDRARKTLKIRR